MENLVKRARAAMNLLLLGTVLLAWSTMNPVPDVLSEATIVSSLG